MKLGRDGLLAGVIEPLLSQVVRVVSLKFFHLNVEDSIIFWEIKVLGVHCQSHWCPRWSDVEALVRLQFLGDQVKGMCGTLLHLELVFSTLRLSIYVIGRVNGLVNKFSRASDGSFLTRSHLLDGYLPALAHFVGAHLECRGTCLIGFFLDCRLSCLY